MQSKTYLVREIETYRIVGIFCAVDSRQLFELIDEQQNPEGCEYLELQAGHGVFFDAVLAEQFDEGDVESGGSSGLSGAEPTLDIETVHDEDYPPELTDALRDEVNRTRDGWLLFTDEDIQGRD